MAITTSLLKLFALPPDVDLSPLIPLPPPTLSASSSSSHSAPTEISELRLRQYHREWVNRESSLIVRLRALEASTMRGETRCWAGRVESRSLVRPARQEAKFVVNVLERVLRWCDEYKGICQAQSEGRRKRYPMVPPAFNTTASATAPFSLAFPLPRVPSPLDFKLCIPRLPSFESTAQGLPAYHEEVDEGERTIMSSLAELVPDLGGMSLLRRITPRGARGM